VIDADKAEFVKVVMGFAELKGKQLSLPAVELYWRAMRDWPLDYFMAAAERLVKTSQFMPEPYHFEELRKSGRMTAGEAFAKALEWAKSGAYRHPAQSPEAIFIDSVVQAMGGWSRIAGSDPDDVQWTEKRFAEHFAELQDVTETREALPQIAMSPGLQILLQRQTKQITGPKSSSPRPALEAAKP